MFWDLEVSEYDGTQSIHVEVPKKCHSWNMPFATAIKGESTQRDPSEANSFQGPSEHHLRCQSS